MWANLLAPLRLPERVVVALGELAGSARELRAIRLELTRVREQTEPLAGMGTASERINDDRAMRLEALHDVQEDIQRMSGLRGERGVAERARDRIVGGKG